MAWTTPTTRIARELMTVDGWNTDVVNNLIYLKSYADKIPLISDGAETLVSNSNLETTIFTGTVPAGTLGTNKMVPLRMWYRMLNNSGGPVTYTFKVKYGGTAIITTAALSVGSSATEIVGTLDFHLRGDGATNAQEGDCLFLLAAVAGWATAINNYFNQGTSAIDSTAAQTLLVTVTMNTASANAQTTSKGTIVFGSF